MTLLLWIWLVACGAKAVPPEAVGPAAEPIRVVKMGSVLSAAGELARLDLRVENTAPWPVTLASVDYSVIIGSREYRVQGVALNRTVQQGVASIIRLEAGVPDGGEPGTVTGSLHWVGPMAAQGRSTAFALVLPVTEVVQ